MSFILTNGNIYTGNSAQPRATALAIAHNRILAIGRDDEIRDIQLPHAEHIDLKGAFVLPGLIDAHLHLEMTGFALQRVALQDQPALDAATAKVRARAQQTPAGQWIRGWGWNQLDWGGTLPTAAHLDAATTAHPVFLSARSGHSGWANSLALRMAGITRDTPNPYGGEIVRDADGEPTGLLLEAAMELVGRVIPEPSFEDEETATLMAMAQMNKKGLTGVHCMDGDGGIQTFGTYQRLRADRRSTLRVVKMLPVQALDAVLGAGLRSGFGDAWLRIGGVKIFADGALGPKSAAMVRPYENEPDNFGIVTFEKEDLVEAAIKCLSHGLSVTTHAIGDRANRDVLDAYAVAKEEGKKQKAEVQSLRNRIEHVQVLQAEDVNRLAALGVIASVQPIHATSDMKMVDNYWGQRGRYAYAFGDLLRSGAHMALGSDAPVETFDPLVGIHAAVTRQQADGTPAEGWYPDQRLSVEQAIHGYTMGAAYAGYSEHELGSLEVGKLADLTLLSHDITQIPPSEILNVQVQRVMVDGEWRT